jgi:3-deoxy-D-manno-octulosonic-acid transferase
VNSAFRAGYEAVAQLARAATWAASVVPANESKLLRTLRARRGIRARYRDWGRSTRDANRPLLWVHAPSVGEGLQARPVLELARVNRPDLQLAYTHFSPSAAAFAQSLDVDFRDYLPFDSAGDSLAALDALRPRALVFSKLDVWPTLASLAHARRVKLGLVSATLSADSSRRSKVAAAFLRDAYRLLDAVGAVDEADAQRLVDLGVRSGAITVTGDTRYDQVWQRAERLDRTKPLLTALRASRPTLVAGSTWPADEAELLPAFASARRSVTGARLVIAPHEPTPTHLEPIIRWATGERLALARLDQATPETDVVLVDRVGVLGDLYALADVAFVGGGFHDAGLHSVLEPAAFGAPVLLGPRYTGSRDAVLLVTNKGGASVTGRVALQERLIEWLTRSPERTHAGERARALVRSGLGAAERSFAVVAGLLD